MEDRIYKLKEKLLGKIEEETQDMSRMNPDRVGTLVDAVHHLAETEYYCAVADSMWEQKHYGGGTGSSAAYTQSRSSYSEQPMRSGYGQQPMGYGSGQMAGYQGNPIETLREKYRNSSPDERERMKHEALQLFGMM